jgi:hypothetical protein
MPREWGKPKRGRSDYNFIAWRNFPKPSQPSIMPTSSASNDHNWLEIPHPSLSAPNSPPLLSDTMLDSRSYQVDEEIPPLKM